MKSTLQDMAVRETGTVAGYIRGSSTYREKLLAMFNALTGAKQRVGNWPGVTVDRKSGEYTHKGKKIEVVDLPGIYSLSAASADEAVALDYILSGEADLIVNIVDASNLERNLYLTVGLLEMKAPLLLALNMMDTAQKRRIDIDINLLSERLGCPVVSLVASREKGIDELRTEINRRAAEKVIPGLQVVYPTEIEDTLDELIPLVRHAGLHEKMNPRYAAVKLLEGDEWISSLAGDRARKTRDGCLKKIEDKLEEEADILLADTRYGLVRWLTREAVTMGSRVGKTLSDRIDSIVLNRALGIPIFLVAMYLMFMVTINIGGAFIDFFDILAGTVFVDGFGELPAAWNTEFGFAVTDDMEIAARYGGSDDGGDLLPETKYGVVLNWGFLENTNLAVEYLHGKFKNDQGKAGVATAQMAIEF